MASPFRWSRQGNRSGGGAGAERGLDGRAAGSARLRLRGAMHRFRERLLGSLARRAPGTPSLPRLARSSPATAPRTSRYGAMRTPQPGTTTVSKANESLRPRREDTNEPPDRALVWMGERSAIGGDSTAAGNRFRGPCRGGRSGGGAGAERGLDGLGPQRFPRRTSPFGPAAKTRTSRPTGRLVSVEVAGPKGLEPSTSGVTGRRSDQLNYDPALGAAGGRWGI